jgi:DNA-binding NtrC family response regulator
MTRSEERPIATLIADDDPNFLRLVTRQLQKCPLDFHLTTALSGQEALEQIRQQDFDVVLLDYKLHDMNGLEILAALHERDSAPLVIIVTSQGNERIAADTMKAGAADYVIKDEVLDGTFPNVILEALQRHRLARETEARRRAEERLAAIQEVVATVQHEVNNPLTVILCHTEQLLENEARPPEEREMLEVIEAMALRLHDVTRKLNHARFDHTTEYATGRRLFNLQQAL